MACAWRSMYPPTIPACLHPARLPLPSPAGGRKDRIAVPGRDDAFLSMGSQMMKAAARFMTNGPKAADEIKSEPNKEQPVHQKKAS